MKNRYDGRMSTAAISLNQMILDRLAHGEMRPLALVVAIRKDLGKSAYIKGDLSKVVQAALRKLVAAHIVCDEAGVYSLATPQPVVEAQ